MCRTDSCTKTSDSRRYCRQVSMAKWELTNSIFWAFSLSHFISVKSVLLIILIQLRWHHSVCYTVWAKDAILIWCFRHDMSGQAPIHIAAHWKLHDIVQLLIKARSNVNLPDQNGRTPLYICVSCLSTKLYMEDLRHQLPCVITLWKAGSDMLNFVEWLHYKGPGLTKALCADYKDGLEFFQWYRFQCTRPQTLKNLCRKAIQKTVTPKGLLKEIAYKKLPLPTALQVFVSRKMFYRESRTQAFYNDDDNRIGDFLR